MAEYIKRWDVSNACYDIYEEVVREHKPMTADEVKQTMLRFEKAIQRTPTADVEEVRHGEWIAVPSSDMSTGKAYKCSECGKFRFGCRLPPYCQECGAKMDGRSDT